VAADLKSVTFEDDLKVKILTFKVNVLTLNVKNLTCKAKDP